MKPIFRYHPLKAISLFLLLVLLTLPAIAGAQPLKSSPAESGTAPQASEAPVLDQKVFLPIISRSDLWVENPYGIENESTFINNSLAIKTDELNPGWVRMNARITWSELQPVEDGPIQWDLLADFEKELILLKTQRTKPIVIVDEYPSWATIADNSCSPLRQDKFAAFASFMQALVNRYSTPLYDVYNWELGNEVDVDPRLVPVDSHYGCWGDITDLDYYGGDYYGEMVKVVGAAIKEANPAARVWLGGLMVATPSTTDPNLGKPENFLRGILAAGAAPYFDVVSYHGHVGWYGSRKDGFYNTGSIWYPYGGGNVGKAEFLRGIMQEYGVAKTLFLSEAGVGCPESVVLCANPPESFFEYQADEGIRLIVPVVTEPDIEGFIWYQLPGQGWRYSGLLNGNYTEKQIFTAYKHLTKRTWGSDPMGRIDYGTGLDAYEFKKGNQLTHVVWTVNDDIIPVTIPANEFIGAFDRDGEPITPNESGNNYIVTASFSPIYIVRRPGVRATASIWADNQEVGAHEVALFRKDFFSMPKP